MDKSEQAKERVKIYDKYMYVSQEKFKTAILIIVVFLIGFLTGYLSKDSIEKSNKESENTTNSSYSAENDNITDSNYSTEEKNTI